MSALGIGAPSLVDVGAVGGAAGPALVWRLARPALASTIVGGGLGPVSWILSITVVDDYWRHDASGHLGDVAAQLGLSGRGVGFMTAVDVGTWSQSVLEGVEATATVGARRAVWAADWDVCEEPWAPGTINLVAWAPVRFSDAALVNVAAMMTEAKVQALIDSDIAGTGTASDAVCILCPLDGPHEPFGGPRSRWGARVARAAYVSIMGGIAKQAPG